MKSFASLFILLLMANISTAQVRKKLEKEINKILKYDIHVDYEKVPGFVLGVMIEDSTYVFSFGTKEKGTTDTPDGNTIFEIGDVTKVFTASLLHQCVKEGQVQYDAVIDQYLPAHQKNVNTNKTTILDLVTHTSGLPKMPYGFGLKEEAANNPYASYTTKDLISFYKEFAFPNKVEKEYLFSNVNFAILGELLEKKYGQSYEQLLVEKLLQPIGMKDTRISLSANQLTQAAQGYSLAGRAVNPWEYQSFESSVGLKSSVNDLLKFMHAQVNNQQFGELHQSLYRTDIDKHTHIAKGWHVLKNKRFYDLIAHAGTTSGHRAFMGFVKESKTGVVVLSNSKMGMNGFGYLVLKMVNHHWKRKKL